VDRKILKLARQLQTKLALIDDQTEPGEFRSVHGLLVELVNCIETAIPDLTMKRLRAEAEADIEEARRLLKEMTFAKGLPDDPDSLEQIERRLGGDDPEHPIGVPAKQKPGPKLDFDTIFSEVVHCQWFGASKKV
jgi:hypothetical protein